MPCSSFCESLETEIQALKLESFDADSKYLRELPFYKIENFSLVKFDFEQFQWVEGGQEINSKGLYRTKDRFGLHSYILNNGREKYQILEDEWAFLIAARMLDYPIFKTLSDNCVVVAWQCKIPNLIKRILASGACRIRYGREGIGFYLNNNESKENIIRFIYGRQ